MRSPAAAEWIVEVEREAQRIPGLVATVGQFEAKPGATNVIAGEARLTLDVRHGSDDVRIAARGKYDPQGGRNRGAPRVVRDGTALQ